MRFCPILILSTFALAACQESFDKRLQREAREFTANHCPQEPEPGSRLDSTTYDPADRTYTSWYSLNANNELVLSSNTPLLRHRLLKQLAADVNHKALKDEQVNFRFVYRSQATGNVIYETRIEAGEYARP